MRTGIKPLVTALTGKLDEDKLKLVPRSYDLVGSGKKAVAIVEIPEELKDEKKIIGEAVLKINKNVKSVLSKLSGRRGAYRLKDYELIAGVDDTEVMHREHGCNLKLDPRKVFFSPRELTERQRVASQVKAGETVLVMFSGAGPYPIAIAKKQSNVNKIYGIEINSDAHRYAEENVRINKLSHKIVLINGDVREVCPRLKIKFDRIAMPLSTEGYKYLDLAISCLKDGGIIHFYHISPEKDLFIESEKIVKDAGKKLKRKIEFVNKIKVLPYGTRYWKICLDVKIT
jgi:tRNA (guanine37-N1)-methyltransferase